VVASVELVATRLVATVAVAEAAVAALFVTVVAKALSWDIFTASVGAIPGATLTIILCVTVLPTEN
jgi:hypothetical protein